MSKTKQLKPITLASELQLRIMILGLYRDIFLLVFILSLFLNKKTILKQTSIPIFFNYISVDNTQKTQII